MKHLTLLAFMFFTGMALPAQEQSPISKISRQMTDYFSFSPREKIFITTDKNLYKPGETIWFRAFVTAPDNKPVAEESRELFVKLYDKNGKANIQDIFMLKNGSSQGDLTIPEDLPKGSYFLVAITSAHFSPEEIPVTALTIDPEYGNQWIAKISVKDSISVPNQKNELYLTLFEVSGDIQKNTSLRYQLKNGAEIIEKGKLKTDGEGKAHIPFTLPDRSNGEPFSIEIGANKNDWKQEIFLPSALDPVIITFYPEGGSLITGTPAKIGFTATNKWGIPVDVEGSVLDQEGKQVSLVRTLTKGIGLFSVENNIQQKLKLVLSGKTGQNQWFDLPAPKPGGLSLSVVKTDAEFISASIVFADKQKHPVALTVTQGGALCWAGDMEIDGTGRIKIPVEKLTHGINLLSVFSQAGVFLAQRIVFIDKKHQMKIEVQPAKQNLRANESMKVSVRLTDENNQPLSGNIAVAVSDKHRNNDAVNLIDNCLMIDAELETPYSFVSGALKSGMGNSALMDIFLIANQVKVFSWEKIQNFKPADADAKKSGNSGISGVVTDKNGNRASRAKVSIVNTKNMQMFTTITNEQGIFVFPNMNSENSDNLTGKATDQEGKRELNVSFDRNFESRLSDYVAAYALKYSLLSKEDIADRTYFAANPDLFQKAPKPIVAQRNSYENQRKLLSNSTNILDVIKTLKAYRIMNNQIVFIGYENSINYQGGALLVLDGQQMGTDISAIANISPAEVDHINVSTNPMDIQRYTGLNSVGVIEIFQKKAEIPKPEITKESTVKYEGGYRVPKVFPTLSLNPKRDNRTTLMWIPEQKIDETGQFEFSVTAGKVLSDFVIQVQGISGNGMAGSAIAKFSVVK